MARPADFMESSVARGLHMGEFRHLGESDKRKLVRLMARIAEQAYRRGVQHGVVLERDEDRWAVRQDLIAWRYEVDLGLSPWLDSPKTTSSIDRLFGEVGVLRNLGFYEPVDPRRGHRKTVWKGYTSEQRARFKRHQNIAEFAARSRAGEDKA